MLDGISVGGQSTREREGSLLLCLIQSFQVFANASTKFTGAMFLLLRVVARSSTLTSASTVTISLCVASLTTGRVFATSPCGATTTVEEIILNLNMWGEEERKRLVLASSRKGQTSFTFPNGNILC